MEATGMDAQVTMIAQLMAMEIILAKRRCIST